MSCRNSLIEPINKNQSFSWRVKKATQLRYMRFILNEDVISIQSKPENLQRTQLKYNRQQQKRRSSRSMEDFEAE
jgi:hypothetical protein